MCIKKTTANGISGFKSHIKNSQLFLEKEAAEDIFLFLVSYVEERPWWPTTSPNNGRKKKVEG